MNHPLLRPITLATLLFSLPLSAAEPSVEQAQAEIAAANQAAMDAAISGPSTINVGEQATLQLPEGFSYVPKSQTQRVLKAFDGKGDPTVEGMILPQSDEENWMMVVGYEAAGYIKDDDAKDWDADELLNNLKEGTKAANEERQARGIPQLEVVGWAQVPTYSANDHHLLWSASAREVGSSDTNYTINYNTLVLGREGYVSMNMVTDAQNVDRLKPVASQLLSAMKFNAGKSYGEYQEGTDKVAAYGLAALVAGAAAKKLGFFAMAALFVAKFAKVGLLALGGLLAAGSHFFKRKKD